MEDSGPTPLLILVITKSPFAIFFSFFFTGENDNPFSLLMLGDFKPSTAIFFLWFLMERAVVQFLY
jgi:hypothetical protein